MCTEQQDAGKRVWCWDLALPGFKLTLKNFEFFLWQCTIISLVTSRLMLYRWFVGVESPYKFVADWFHLEGHERLGMLKGNNPWEGELGYFSRFHRTLGSCY